RGGRADDQHVAKGNEVVSVSHGPPESAPGRRGADGDPIPAGACSATGKAAPTAELTAPVSRGTVHSVCPRWVRPSLAAHARDRLAPRGPARGWCPLQAVAGGTMAVPQRPGTAPSARDRRPGRGAAPAEAIVPCRRAPSSRRARAREGAAAITVKMPRGARRAR